MEVRITKRLQKEDKSVYTPVCYSWIIYKHFNNFWLLKLEIVIPFEKFKNLWKVWKFNLYSVLVYIQNSFTDTILNCTSLIFVLHLSIILGSYPGTFYPFTIFCYMVLPPHLNCEKPLTTDWTNSRNIFYISLH